MSKKSHKATSAASVQKVVSIGVEPQDRHKVAEALSGFLATSYTLYLQTQNYHWNVTGEHFHSLHVLFEEQYTELQAAVDEIAERVRALGAICPASYKAFAKLSAISEPDALPKDAMGMVRALLEGHETASKEARKVLELAESVGDEVTLDMMVERMGVHDKTAWMLRATLG